MPAGARPAHALRRSPGVEGSGDAAGARPALDRDGGAAADEPPLGRRAELRGEPPGPEGSVLKLAFSEAYVRMAETAGSLLGLHGQLGAGAPGAPDGGRWAFQAVFARRFAIAGGTSEIQRGIHRRSRLGLPARARPPPRPALAAEQAGGAMALRYFRSDSCHAEGRPGHVTQADHEAEVAIVERLAPNSPTSGFSARSSERREASRGAGSWIPSTGRRTCSGAFRTGRRCSPWRRRGSTLGVVHSRPRAGSSGPGAARGRGRTRTRFGFRRWNAWRTRCSCTRA